MVLSRRRYLQALAAGGLPQAAGCQRLNGSTQHRADIIAGPDGRLVFAPEEYELTVGDTIQWAFASSGHNLSCRPEHSDIVELPASAEPFSTYDTDESPRTIVPNGETYTHSVDVPGTYTYVCIPHQAAGMTGQLTVTA